jgi:arylsulfatase A-like enzyme
MRRTASAIAFAIGVGALWLAIESAVAIATLPAISVPELLARLVRLGPWHLAIFVGAGLGLALVAPRARPAARLWALAGAGSFAFLGARLVEGLMRSGGPAHAAIGALAASLAVAAAVAALAGLARLLPASRRRAWHAAAIVGWIAAFVVFLERAGYEIGRASMDVRAVLEQFGPRDAVLLALPLGAWLLADARHRAPALLAGLALLAAPFAVGTATGARAPAPAAAAPAAAPDVLVLVLDTLRADHVGRVQDGASLTPNLDALAAASVVFPHAFAPSNWTRGSMPGLLASLPYPVVGNVPAPSLPTFASELRRAGWRTTGASANPLVSARLGWAHGYDVFVDPHSMGDLLVAHPLQLIGAAATAPAYRLGAATNAVYFRDAAEMRRRGLALLDAAPRPAFLHLQTMDTHGPYLPPHRWLPDGFDFGAVSSYYRFMQLRGTEALHGEAFRPALLNFRQRYAASVRHLDAEVGALIEGLRHRGRYDEALIWVVSDHGEAFGEHGVAGHTGLDLGNELVQVPFFVKLPRSWGVAPRREPAAVSTYSMLPTTLSLLGLPPLPEAFGADLAPLVRGTGAGPSEALVCDASKGKTRIRAAIRWPWKLVTLQSVGGEMEVRGLYDLSRGFGDAESHAEAEPAQVAALRAEIERFDARVGALAGARAGEGEIDAVTEEQLRRLGYVE